MPTDQTPKQLVAQRIKDATNILVTVSRNPSVDELSAKERTQEIARMLSGQKLTPEALKHAEQLIRMATA